MASLRSQAALLLAVSVALLMVGCDRPAGPSVPALPPAVVTVAQPLERDVTDYLEYTGTTTAIETVDVRARVEGFLQSINFEPRALVKKDQLLFVIDPSEYKAKLDQALADLAARKAQLDLAIFSFGRTDDLYKKNMATEYERNTDMAKRDAAKAAVEESQAAVEEAKLNLGYTQVTAPIAGRVSRNLVDVGNLVGAAEKTLLTTIVNDSSVYVYFDVSENDLLTLMRTRAERRKMATRPSKLDFPCFLALADETGYPHEGRIDFADTHLDTGTATISVRAIFVNNKDELIPGLFTRIRVPVSQPKRALVVSERALGSDQGQRYLLVVNEKNVVEHRSVKVGRLDGDLRVISEGIGPQDWVIVRGLQRVRSGATVTPQRSGMQAYAETSTKPAASQDASTRVFPKPTH
jgi:membrane fusion protein, multidrug efflux system